MRIISGTHKGKQIHPPRNLPVRPTTDFAKGALFNILNNHFYFESLKVLDLCSGTGSISYEFFSRGCRNITAVDSSFHCVQFIKDNLKKMNMPEINVVKTPVFNFLNHCSQQFDVIFADPPFDFPDTEKIIPVVFEKKLLMEKGWLIVEHPANRDFSGFPFFREKRTYGSPAFSIFFEEI